jgi:hypothetical protein
VPDKLENRKPRERYLLSDYTFEGYLSFLGVKRAMKRVEPF